jgi:hypothetical protein
MKKRLLVGALMFLGACLFVGLPGQASAVNFSNVRAGTITPGSGHVGVDILWGGYNPCHKHMDTNNQTINDAYYGACVMSNSGRDSYYKVYNFTPSGTNFPYGIFIDNQNPNYCTSAAWCPNPSAQTVNHGWANLVDAAALEVYPYNTAGNYDPANNTVGGIRVGVSGFPLYANGGRYSADLGNIALPQLGEANVGKLNGFVTDNGSTVGADRVAFDAFQDGTASRFTSNGYPMYGFSSVRTNNDGYYTLGAVPTGTYNMYVTDTLTGHKIRIFGVGVNTTYERLDFNLDLPCFGYSSCQDPAL